MTNTANQTNVPRFQEPTLDESRRIHIIRPSRPELGVDLQHPQTGGGTKISNKVNRTDYFTHLLDELIDGLCQGAPDTAHSPLHIISSRVYSSYASIIRRLNMKAQAAPFYGKHKFYFLYSKSDSSDLKERTVQTLYFVRSVIEALFDFNQNKILKIIEKDNYSSFIDLYLRVLNWPLSDFVKNAKFFTVYPLARFLRNPLPGPPNDSYGYTGSTGSALLFRGAIKRYIKNRLLSGNKKNLPLFTTLLLGVKRGCAPVPETFIGKSLGDHAIALNRKRTVTSKYIKYIPYFDRFWSKIRSVPHLLTDPSTSASYNSMKSEGGAYGEIFRNLVGTMIPQKYLESMTEYAPGRVVTQHTYLPIRTYNELFYSMPEEDSAVKVHPIVEPLKVRLITKGPAHRMWFARQVQKAMWNHLQTIPAFALTGHPLSHYDIEELNQRHRKLGLTGLDNWVSGDYSAATDNLKIEYTKLSLETTLRNLRVPEEFRDSIRSVMYEQKLVYPKRYTDVMFSHIMSKKPDSYTKEEWYNHWLSFEVADSASQRHYEVPQNTGQLMGSILSFPILCACNLVAYWVTLEDYLGRKVDLKDLPVLVNGDDILFRCNEPFYNSWLENIKEIGFELSVGKNYVHPNFLVVNSEPYWLSDRLEKVNYYNIGLLTGQSKLHHSEKESSLAPIWDYYNKVMSGACNKVRAHHRFLSMNAAKIRRITFDGLYNLFIDPFFGGLGFNLYPEIKPYIKLTTFQRQFGHYLYNKWKDMQGPLPSRPLTLVQEHKQRRSIVTKQHYGRYKLLPYTMIGSLSNPEYTLVLDEFQRLIKDYSVKAPIISEVPYVGDLKLIGQKAIFQIDKTMAVRQPSKSLLKDFRKHRPKIISVRPLLARPRAIVEQMMSIDPLGRLV